jgi:hypothetical protein
LNDGGEVKVNKQVLVAFFISKYYDKVLCDVVLMQASYMLLGKLWQYDRRVTHDGVTNRYSSKMNGRHITLVSLTPKQIYEEQLKLNKKKMVEKKSLYLMGPSLLTRIFLVLIIMIFFDLVLICLP